jgi:hypothetical protein
MFQQMGNGSQAQSADASSSFQPLSTVADIQRQAGSILPVPQTISLTVKKL